MNLASELLADCASYGIRLLPAGDDELTIDAPQDALTPELIGRLKAHKIELLTILRPGSIPPAVGSVATNDADTKPTTPVCRCGSTIFRDVAIHDGQSTRRDCGQCGRFIEFPIWHGYTTLHIEQ